MKWTEILLLDLINTSVFEWFAIVFNALFFVEVYRKRKRAWIYLGITSVIYAVLCFKELYFMEGLLQVLFLVLSVIAFITWSGGAKGLSFWVNIWEPKSFLYTGVYLLIITLVIGSYYSLMTHLDYPFFDAWLKTMLLLGYFMLMRRTKSGWIVLFIACISSIGLYMMKSYYLISVLYGVFSLLTLIGLVFWQRDVIALKKAPENQKP